MARHQRLSSIDVELIGLPFDGFGRAGAVADAPRVLRRAGLVNELARVCRVVDCPDFKLAAPSPYPRVEGGLRNETALLDLISKVRGRVEGAWSSGRWPLLFGGDCAALLGAIPAARDRFGEVGLLFVDGHEDAYTLEDSPDRQAADSEVAFLLGRGLDGVPQSLAALLPALAPKRLAMIGPRYASDRPTLENEVLLWRDRDVHSSNLKELSVRALKQVSKREQRWWLHVDLDVLSASDFSAHDFVEPGGIRWRDLNTITDVVLQHPGCVGWSVVIYNPDLDPDRTVAAEVITYIARGVRSLSPSGSSASPQ